MIALHFKVPGAPQGKARPRFVKATGRAYTPQQTASYEALIAMAGASAMNGRVPIEGPVHVVVTAVFPIPASWPKKRKLQAESGLSWHLCKPDGDNILKAVGDGLNGVVWKDDKQIALSKVQKLYGDKPGLDILVQELAA